MNAYEEARMMDQVDGALKEARERIEDDPEVYWGEYGDMATPLQVAATVVAELKTEGVIRSDALGEEVMSVLERELRDEREAAEERRAEAAYDARRWG